MNHPTDETGSSPEPARTPLWLMPLKVLAWPFVAVFRVLYEHWFSYLIGRVLRDEDRVYSIKFIWYGDSVYLHPMVWGSLVLFFVTKSEVFTPGWPLLVWFIALAACFLTVMYNFDIVKASVLLVSVVAIFSLAYVANSEWEWNPLSALARHIEWLKAEASPGFFVVSAYTFAVLIAAEVIWAWLFNRVEIDESYVYEHRFLQSTSREPIFARGLKRETKDLLELLILGAADIKHRTKTGYKTFTNVPAASLGLGAAIDSLLDFRRPGEIELDRKLRGETKPADEHDAGVELIDELEGHPDEP
ncbi:MAG: hypothetical protein ACYC3X_14455 [Pirellulaceae bacterium]